jgi:hypothetical protein
VAVVVADTLVVDTVADPLLLPAGTVSEAGTVADGELDASATTAPPEGAAAVSDTVSDDVPPPTTLDGLSAADERVALGAGGGGEVTVHPERRALTGPVPSSTSTVQSAGAW